MTNIVLFDYGRKNLFPFTFTRPVADLRIGILTIREHWELMLEDTVSFMTEPYLSKKFPVWKEDENLFINGALIPNVVLVNAARSLALGQRLVKQGIPLAAYAEGWPDPASPYGHFRDVEYTGEVDLIENIWDLFTKNDLVMRAQYKLITAGRRSATLSSSNTVINPHQVFAEEGVKAECVIINASTGPVYIGKNAEIMEGAMIRGPFALGEHATIKMGARIYGATTIGPYCKAGGEISNSIMYGYSNKAHDGFLGNSVVGEWCNLGADTNNSNLKNNYSEVRVHHIASGKQVSTGLTFCGLFMGDHAKCGINTMFNTGTVVGVGANIFGAGFPPKFVPPFSWGGFEDSPVFLPDRVLELARQVFQRRGRDFDSTEENLLRAVFNMTESPA